MAARRNISKKFDEPAPFLVMTGPDEDWGFEIEALGLIPCFNLIQLERIFQDVWDSRSHGGTVWAVFVWNRVKRVYEFLPPEKVKY